MKRHLIIIGNQATGKTLLGQWLESNTMAITVDEATIDDIIRLSSPCTYPTIFICQQVDWDSQPKEYWEQFLIIKLTSL